MKKFWNNIEKLLIEAFADEKFKMRWVVEDMCILMRGAPHPMAYTREI